MAVNLPSERPDTSDMLMIHGVFRGELQAAPARIQGVVPGDLDRARLIGDHYAFVLAVLHIHHETEDELLWPKLNQRVEFKRELVARMEAQHAAIAGELTQSNETLERWAKTGALQDAGPLLESLSRLTAVLEHHLGEEEQQILPIAADHLSVKEWGELGQHGMAAVPAEWMPVTLGLCLRNLPPEARPVFLAQMPEGVPVLWTSQWETIYEAHMASLEPTA
ncbi:MAG: hemerythrin domain-containing protein [Candidatus Dormiibacterota bacterium]